MIATISETGVLTLNPSTELEGFALRAWIQSFRKKDGCSIKILPYKEGEPITCNGVEKYIHVPESRCIKLKEVPQVHELDEPKSFKGFKDHPLVADMPKNIIFPSGPKEEELKKAFEDLDNEIKAKKKSQTDLIDHNHKIVENAKKGKNRVTKEIKSTQNISKNDNQKEVISKTAETLKKNKGESSETVVIRPPSDQEILTYLFKKNEALSATQLLKLISKETKQKLKPYHVGNALPRLVKKGLVIKNTDSKPTTYHAVKPKSVASIQYATDAQRVAFAKDSGYKTIDEAISELGSWGFETRLKNWIAENK